MWQNTRSKQMSVAVLVSGGVDSSVALHRTVSAFGPDRVHAYYLKIWLEDDVSFLGSCPWEDDIAYARAVCDGLGVALHTVSLQREYYERVVAYALDELRAGRTPSPDIFCNRRIKFGAFWDALGDSIDSIATGHYAQTRRTEGGVELLRAPDPVKDQTYFLSHLSQEQARVASFPIGSMKKAEVRAEARRLELPNRDRPDSQGICFLGRLRYPDFVRAYLGEREGAIVERESGSRLGTHRGAWFYTIGQRQGLGLGNGPWYVVEKRMDENVVFVSHQRNDHDRMVSEYDVEHAHWILSPPERSRLDVKLRHGPDLVTSRVTLLPGDTARVELSRPDGGVAPGQFTVFYDGDVCLGGATIADIRRGECV